MTYYFHLIFCFIDFFLEGGYFEGAFFSISFNHYFFLAEHSPLFTQ